MDEMLWCYHSNETSLAKLLRSTFYYFRILQKEILILRWNFDHLSTFHRSQPYLPKNGHPLTTVTYIRLQDGRCEEVRLYILFLLNLLKFDNLLLFDTGRSWHFPLSHFAEHTFSARQNFI